jgi:prepilin-type N-terminal cleavage/methylation domain-containing protein
LSSYGFTSIELIVTVAIAAVLSAIAVPSFNFIFERWRVMEAVEIMKSSLMFARSKLSSAAATYIWKSFPEPLLAASPTEPPRTGIAAGSSSWTAMATGAGTVERKSSAMNPQPK